MVRGYPVLLRFERSASSQTVANRVRLEVDHDTRRFSMWAQLIKARFKPGQEDEARRIQEEIAERERQSPTGWVRSIRLQNQNDPQEFYSLIFFESEEKARQREQSPEQQALVQRIWACMDGRPEFVDFNVVEEISR
jgi:quinol monooxygenase YgiN